MDDMKRSCVNTHVVVKLVNEQMKFEVKKKYIYIYIDSSNVVTEEEV